jgi:transposase-like protein
MPRRTVVPPEEKIAAVEAYLSGELGTAEAIQKFNVNKASWHTWIRLYKTRGPEGLVPQSNNRKYSSALKEIVVREYLAGKGSLRNLCGKYSISNHAMVMNWIKRYNGQKYFKEPSRGKGIYMTRGRTTTLNERIEIVSYCISNGNDYGATIEKYRVSYQQIYSWVSKYREKGVEGLIDKRGKRKSFEEMTEVERLRAELKILDAENKRKDMEITVLKKVQEIERRRG